jgi:adhesin/invasin
MRPVRASFLVSLLALAGCGGSTGPSGGSKDQHEAPPASIVIYLGNGQNGPAGSQLPGPLCTNVLDAGKNLLHGIVVTYTVASGGGTIGDPTTPSTDPNGVATSGLWTLGPGTGVQSVTASAVGAGSVTFTATAR